MRFADLFLTRERWKAEHAKPYLSDISVDTKDLDKLLLRALMEKGVYTTRARELEKGHCSSSSLFFDSTVPCNRYLFLRRLF